MVFTCNIDSLMVEEYLQADMLFFELASEGKLDILRELIHNF